jgi:hypothetical protein
MTYRELKEFVNSIPEEFLDNSVFLSDEDCAHSVDSADLLSEDYFVDDEGTTPVSLFDENDYGEPLSEFEIVPKGTPYLYHDF